jgi:glycosyltransferase involved in cell wall biosynthesis
MRDGFDAIHVANPPDSLVPLLAIYRLLGKSIIFDQHDLSPELYSLKFARPSKVVIRLLTILEYLSYRLSTHVIVTNESYAEIARRRGHLQKERIAVVRNSPDMPPPTENDVDSDLRNKATIILAFGGETGKQDGLDNLCLILQRLRHEFQREDFYCVVMGDGDALSSTKNLARDLGLEDCIWFTGWISDPERYRRYLRTADICISPEGCNAYNDHSTFIKIMEYMSVEKPIVAFDLTETRNTAKEAALYAKRNDVRDFARHIESLMDDSNLRRQLGTAGRERVECELAWQHSVSRLLSVYNSL